MGKTQKRKRSNTRESPSTPSKVRRRLHITPKKAPAIPRSPRHSPRKAQSITGPISSPRRSPRKQMSMTGLTSSPHRSPRKQTDKTISFNSLRRSPRKHPQNKDSLATRSFYGSKPKTSPFHQEQETKNLDKKGAKKQTQPQKQQRKSAFQKGPILGTPGFQRNIKKFKKSPIVKMSLSEMGSQPQKTIVASPEKEEIVQAEEVSVPKSVNKFFKHRNKANSVSHVVVHRGFNLSFKAGKPSKKTTRAKRVKQPLSFVSNQVINKDTKLSNLGDCANKIVEANHQSANKDKENVSVKPVEDLVAVLKSPILLLPSQSHSHPYSSTVSCHPVPEHTNVSPHSSSASSTDYVILLSDVGSEAPSPDRGSVGSMSQMPSSPNTQVTG